MSFPRYTKYKPSGVEWLGEVPQHWDVTPLKHLATLKGRLGWQGLRADEYTEDGPFLVTSEHFTNDKIDWQRCHHVAFERYALAPEIQLRPDDLLMMKDGAAMGKLAYVDHLPAPACLNSHLLLFRPLDGQFTNRFLYYVLSGPCFKTFMVQERTGTTFFGISQESIGTFPLALPNVTEQIAIATFLDRETAKIDGLVGEQRRLIELLKEKRQAVISHAVTQGLNPHAPRKPSGIEWLGDVPEHWEVKPLKYVLSLKSGGTPSKENRTYWDGGIPWASSKDLKTHELFDTQDHITQKALDDGAADLVPPGSILTVVRGMILLHTFPVVVARVPMAINQDLKAILPTPEITADFLAWLLRGASGEVLSRTDEAGHGTKVLRIETWLAMEVPVPPLHEQKAIVANIISRLEELDALTAEAERGIELLQERRTALISAAVTGQIDVRHINPLEATT
jgi:type I restriction enzyme S subunit